MNNVYTVSQINTYIKRLFTEDYLLAKIYVKGEVSNCKYHSSGHIYFTLKDESAVMTAVMFAGNRSGLSFKMQEGQTVIVLGSISVYERDGKYQLYAREILLDGAGLLYQKFEELKNSLEEMGMFSEEYKKTIPAYARKIGIVTAKTGAAIQDIINITRRRNPYVQLYLYPAKVQGEGAAEMVAEGLWTLDQMGLDVIIVGRGGGSIEDLWAFNEEVVARAIFNCNTPVISGVGHETDTTISDFVADLRAPTPSAAAELAVFNYNEFSKQLSDSNYLINKRIKEKIESVRRNLEHSKVRLGYLSPLYQINQKKLYIPDLETRLNDSITGKMKDIRHELAISSEKLNGLSPLNRLNKGYSYITDETGRGIKSAQEIHEGQIIRIEFKDGQALTKILQIEKRGE